MDLEGTSSHVFRAAIRSQRGMEILSSWHAISRLCVDFSGERRHNMESSGTRLDLTVGTPGPCPIIPPLGWKHGIRRMATLLRELGLLELEL